MVAGSLVYAVLTAVDCLRMNGSTKGEMMRALGMVLVPFLIYLGWTLWALKELSEGDVAALPWLGLFLSAVVLHAPIAIGGAMWVRRRLHAEGGPSNSDPN